MERNLPGWVRSHAKAHDDAECAEYAEMTPADRWRRFIAVTRLSEALFAANDHQSRARALRDERDPEAIALWRRLMARRG